MNLAPNGKPSNLTPEQYKLVRTTEFKAWFGDWENNPEGASKVVDSNGEPLPVYHGTNAEPFVVFDGGSFFTDDYMNADGYASGEMVYEVFLNIKKPLIINARGRKWDNLKNKYGNSTRDIVGQLDMDKYDGVIFNNINDNWFDDEMGDTQNVYFSINPEQIKLADGTNTTFDGNNPDIRYAGGGELPKTSKDENGNWSGEYLGHKFTLYNLSEGWYFSIYFYSAIMDNQEIYESTEDYIPFRTKKDALNIIIEKIIEINSENEYFNKKRQSNNPDIRYAGGGEIESYKEQGILELNFYPTNSEHAKEGGVDAKKPLYIQNLIVKESYRLKNIGKKVLLYLDEYAQKNGHDVIFGYVNQKAIMTRDNRTGYFTEFTDIDYIKHWLFRNGYNVNRQNNNFYKVVGKTNPDIRFKEGGVLTYREYADTQFNEEEDRYLPSDYFDNLEIKKASKDNLPLIKIKDGLEYRKWGNSSIKVFDNDYLIAFADQKAIQVAKQYQKRGIGLELVFILKEMNPNHRFGSMTPQGFNLMGKYYDTYIANNSDIRFDGGGEARPFTNDGNKLVVFNQYRNYTPYKIAVNDVNNAEYITLWKTDTDTGKDKKMGYLRLNNSGDDFLSVSEISIDRGSKGLGLGLEMYKVALKYSSDKIKGIKSYLPNRTNKKQIPKIYKKLNSVKDGDYEFIYKENNPDIRFDKGGLMSSKYQKQINKPMENFRRGGMYIVQKKGQYNPDMAETLMTANNLDSLRKKIEEKYGTSKGFYVQKRDSSGGFRNVNFEQGGSIQPKDFFTTLMNHTNDYSLNVYGEPIDKETFSIETRKIDENHTAKRIVAETVLGNKIDVSVSELYKVYKHGGKVDLFEYYEQQPKELSDIIEPYMSNWEDGDADYSETQKLLSDVEKLGYTFEYGLDNSPYGLRKKEVALNELKGYESFFNGGEVFYKENNGLKGSIKYHPLIQSYVTYIDEDTKEFNSLSEAILFMKSKGFNEYDKKINVFDNKNVTKTIATKLSGIIHQMKVGEASVSDRELHDKIHDYVDKLSEQMFRDEFDKEHLHDLSSEDIDSIRNFFKKKVLHTDFNLLEIEQYLDDYTEVVEEVVEELIEEVIKEVIEEPVFDFKKELIDFLEVNNVDLSKIRFKYADNDNEIWIYPKKSGSIGAVLLKEDFEIISSDKDYADSFIYGYNLPLVNNKFADGGMFKNYTIQTFDKNNPSMGWVDSSNKVFNSYNKAFKEVSSLNRINSEEGKLFKAVEKKSELNLIEKNNVARKVDKKQDMKTEFKKKSVIDNYDLISKNDELKKIIDEKGNDKLNYSQEDLKQLRNFYSETEISNDLAIKIWGLVSKQGFYKVKSNVLVINSSTGNILNYVDDNFGHVDAINTNVTENTISHLLNNENAIRYSTDTSKTLNIYDLIIYLAKEDVDVSYLNLVESKLIQNNLFIFVCPAKFLEGDNKVKHIINDKFNVSELYWISNDSNDLVLCVLKKK